MPSTAKLENSSEEISSDICSRGLSPFFSYGRGKTSMDEKMAILKDICHFFITQGGQKVMYVLYV